MARLPRNVVLLLLGVIVMIWLLNDSNNNLQQKKSDRRETAHAERRETTHAPQAPVSSAEVERMLQSHRKLYEEARETQERFCREWSSRSPGPNPRTTLKQVQSVFNRQTRFHMELYSKNDVVSGAVLNDGFWEKGQTLRFAKWCSDYAKKHNIPLSNVTFVDIGANIGWYTLNLADMGVNVIAIEPMPTNVEMIRRSLCRNPQLASRITLYELGLSTVSNQTCHVYSPKANVGDGVTYCANNDDDGGNQFVGDESLVHQASVPQRRVDDVIGDALPHHRHIAALKMDTEGHEGRIVRGGPILFGSGRIPHVQSEYNPEWIQRTGESPRVMLNTFFRAGYRVQRHGDCEPLSQAQALNVTPGAPLAGHHDILLELVEEPVYVETFRGKRYNYKRSICPQGTQ